MNKSHFLKTIVTFHVFVCLITFAHYASAQCRTDVVTTGSGPVCGTVVKTSTGKSAEAFLAVPFGQSTAGDNRFRPPVPVEPWTELFVADTYGASCPQPASIGFDQSEDCLHLYLWRPEKKNIKADLPVMVFIYGGAFIEGGAELPLYDGSYLAANQDVIVININYRIGALGFLATNELEGNYGFMDQQLGLKWIHDNVKSFGGDLDKITIFGESAGAMSVGLHLLSAPDSKDLFRAGIMQSNPFGLPFKTIQEARNLGNVFQAMLNCKDADCLRKLTFAEIVSEELFLEQERPRVFTGLHYYLSWVPVIDGTVITKDPFHAFTDGELEKPVIMGTNKDEGELFEGIARLVLGTKARLMFSFDGYVSYLASIFGLDFEKVENKYPAIDGDNETMLANVLTDFAFLCANHNAARLSTAKGDLPVYIYRFDHLTSFNILCLPECDDFVCHMAELPFIFHTDERSFVCKKSPFRKKTNKFTKEEEALSLSMIEYWTNFAKHLSPNGPDNNSVGVKWPPFAIDDPQYMIFDTPAIKTVKDPFSHICDFWDNLGYFVKTPWGDDNDE